MITEIIETETGYRATLDGVAVTIPADPGNRDFQAIQDAIAAGAPVTVYTGPSLAERRASASIERTPFCQKLWRLGVLPQSEAIEAAKGNWPATFAAFTAGLSADDAADAQIEWAGAVTIRYTAPTLQALALAKTGGDAAAATALLDAIFGLA